MNNNWTIEQTAELFELCERARESGGSLTAAFKQMAERTSRSLNSVRNYYYSQAKTFDLVPDLAQRLGIKRSKVSHDRFVPFDEREVRALVENVLVAKGKGISVRRAIATLAGGDGKKALRYQNKYRSVLRSHRDLVKNIVADLAERKMPYVDPYANKSSGNIERLTEYLSTLDDARVGKFLDIIEKLT